ncbi:hypothetical protein [Macrococcus bovicus]|uniref:hypothetical protein n=1 Tax=Macrococcus bovicus TaxID=69968 RepID=UPI0025A4F8C5|nr:hypothetical protein [Macrococcus bovicus]WJP97082.1 hypothetical protein QSV55_07295 [Macrococcus bovicus]
MAKMIKRTVEMRLDELIKHIFDNAIVNRSYYTSDRNVCIEVNSYGGIDTDGYGNGSYPREEHKFAVEVEEEITKEMPINAFYRLRTDGGWKSAELKNTSVSKLIEKYRPHVHVTLSFIYLLNEDGSIGELIWTEAKGLEE